MKTLLEKMKLFRPDEYRMREMLASAQKDGNPDGLPWYQSASGRVVSKGEGDGPDQKYRFIITTPTVDRMGDIVRSDGMDNKNFRKNPQVLYNHDDWKNLGIGISLNETVFPGKRVEAEMIFDLDNDPSGMAKAIKGKVDKGYLTATSIRFSPHEYELIYEEVETDRGAREEWTGGFDFKSWELLEWSIVSIPANPECVRRAYGVLVKGRITSDDDEVFRSTLEKLVAKQMEPFLAQLAELKTLVEQFEKKPEEVPDLQYELALHDAIKVLREIEPMTVGG